MLYILCHPKILFRKKSVYQSISSNLWLIYTCIELSTGHFSWTRPDPTRGSIRPVDNSTSRLHLFLLLGRFVAGKSWTMMLFVRLYSLVRSASLLSSIVECLQSNYSNSTTKRWLWTSLFHFIGSSQESPAPRLGLTTSVVLPREPYVYSSVVTVGQLRLDRDKLAWITGLRDKHRFFKEKESSYWEHIINSNASDSKKLWRSVSTMLGKPAKQQSSLPPFSAADFLAFLEKKVDVVRSATAGAPPPPPPVFSHTDCHLNSFEVCTQAMVERTIKASPAKCCELDPAPTFLVKDCLDILSPFLTLMCNASIQEGILPASQKEAIVIPALKKSGLDTDDMKNYRPISNLSFMSKVVEKLIFEQLSVYLAENNLFPKLQSGFRRFHSTESAVLRVLSDIYSVIDRGDVALLALLDVSAAFDTVDHSILLERLSTSFGLGGQAYSWFDSYISGRSQSVRLGALHHPRHQSVSEFLKDRYLGLSSMSSIPPMLPGLSNHSGFKFTSTPTIHKSTVPAVSHDRSS